MCSSTRTSVRALSDGVLEKTREVVEREHETMQQCPKCGSLETTFVSQTMVLVGVVGDILRYQCRRCGHHYERFFPFRAGDVPGELYDVFKLGAKKDT